MGTPSPRAKRFDGSHTLAEFHDGIFDAFDRLDAHAREFRTRDEDGIVTRRYVHPQMYSGDPSWPPMDDEEIDHLIEQDALDDTSADAKERFRDLRKNPPTEGNTAETTIDEIEPERWRNPSRRRPRHRHQRPRRYPTMWYPARSARSRSEWGVVVIAVEGGAVYYLLAVRGVVRSSPTRGPPLPPRVSGSPSSPPARQTAAAMRKDRNIIIPM